MRQELMNDQASYLEPEAEMTAIYLEAYANKVLSANEEESETQDDDKTIEYRIDEQRFKDIFGAVVREDEAWRGDGPYTATRRGWGVADYKTNPFPVDAESKPKQKTLNIYQIGERIKDFSMIERYVSEGKKLDLEFVRNLYTLFLEQKRLAEQPLEKTV